MRTRFSTMTEEEFLREIDSKKDNSPVIHELVMRLADKHGNGYHVDAETNHECECPVCECNILVEHDWGNERFELKVSDL